MGTGSPETPPHDSLALEATGSPWPFRPRVICGALVPPPSGLGSHLLCICPLHHASSACFELGSSGGGGVGGWGLLRKTDPMPPCSPLALTFSSAWPGISRQGYLRLPSAPGNAHPGASCLCRAQVGVRAGLASSVFSGWTPAGQGLSFFPHHLGTLGPYRPWGGWPDSSSSLLWAWGTGPPTGSSPGLLKCTGPRMVQVGPNAI